MALKYSSGFGRIYDKEAGKIIDEVRYQLVETDQTKYTKKKWWGEFSTKQKIDRPGNYIIEVDDGRKGECIVSTNADGRKGLVSLYHYRFYGRGKLGRHFSIWS